MAKLRVTASGASARATKNERLPFSLLALLAHSAARYSRPLARLLPNSRAQATSLPLVYFVLFCFDLFLSLLFSLNGLVHIYCFPFRSCFWTRRVLRQRRLLLSWLRRGRSWGPLHVPCPSPGRAVLCRQHFNDRATPEKRFQT